uniref:Uncharacterized protein n=1 Tax=Glossina brevipalpis TaxID=37001 RepID=A0A1A9W5G9_9MUSC
MRKKKKHFVNVRPDVVINILDGSLGKGKDVDPLLIAIIKLLFLFLITNKTYFSILFNFNAGEYFNLMTKDLRDITTKRNCEKAANTYRGGQVCVLHNSTVGSGRLAALHRASSTSVPVTRLRHITRDIL